MASVKTVIIGAGGIVRFAHLPAMLADASTELVGIVENSPASIEALAEKAKELNRSIPQAYDSLDTFLQSGVQAHVAFIATPHSFHCEQIVACLEAGMDVCVEKPMVITREEAEAVIAKRDETGRLVVVAFPGSLSPAVTKAREMLAGGEIGKLISVSGTVHQGWKAGTTGKWRQDPKISGGGFLFDTGSHLVNTMVDLVGSPVHSLHAHLDNSGTPVEINAAIAGTFENGVAFTINGCGESHKSCDGYALFIGAEGVIQVGMWGHYLRKTTGNIGNHAKWEDVSYGEGTPAWINFLKVLNGEIDNPCPPEVGLRFSEFMDSVRAAAERTGKA